MTTRLEQYRNASAEEARCECGQLVAKLQQNGIEVKCKRCKRIVTIPFASIEGWTAPSPSVCVSSKKKPATAN